RELSVHGAIWHDAMCRLSRRLENIRRLLIDADHAQWTTADLHPFVERLNVAEELLRDIYGQNDDRRTAQLLRACEPATIGELTTVDLGVPLVGADDDADVGMG